MMIPTYSKNKKTKEDKGGNNMKYTSLLPFMDSEEITELARKVMKGEVQGVKLITLYPFLDSETLDEIAEYYIKEGKGSTIVTLLPFISTQKVNALYEKVREGSIEGVDERVFLPFLGKSQIKEMFYDLVKKASTDLEDEESEENESEDDE